MVSQLRPEPAASLDYPDSDGQPMADNTRQFRWIVMIKENLELLFRDEPQVFVAGDLLWYPVEGDSTIRQAPDVMVVGRPKGDRGSYCQWEEGNLAPQVVFEILSPGNRFGEMLRKLRFYERYGVEEYYIYDPDKLELTGLQRQEDTLKILEDMNGWVSPRLQIRFQMTPDTLEIYRRDELLNFPCVDLRTIDRLWVKYSQGKFGFSVQKQIYVECGAKLDGRYPGDEIWYEFCDRVGWREGGNYLSYDDLKANPYFSPTGEFPALELDMWVEGEWDYVLSSLLAQKACEV